MSDPNEKEPTVGEYVDAVANVGITPEEKAAVDEIEADLTDEIMEIYHRVAAEVAAEHGTRPE